MKSLKSCFLAHFPKVPPNHLPYFCTPTTTFSTSIYENFSLTHYLLLSSFTSKIVDFRGITWILILFQTNNYRFYYPLHYSYIHCMCPFIHCIHCSQMSLLLQLDYEHHMNNSYHLSSLFEYLGFPGGSEVKASACNAGDLGSIPGSGKSPGEGNGNPLQYSCLENPMDGGAWWAYISPWGRKESDTTE